MAAHRRRWTAAMATAALLASACGGSDAGSPGDALAPAGDDAGSGDASGDGSGAAALAIFDLVDPAADYRAAAASDFVEATDGQGLDAGDHVRTDIDGFAVIEYVDGSATRLDRATEFRVVALAGTAEAPQVRMRLDIGRAWNNVTDAAADGEFAVETAVGTAAVRGTIFMVECLVRTLCRFWVVEGQVEVTPTGGEPIVLGPGQQVVISGDEVGDVGPAAEEPGADGFLDRNRALDGGGDDPGSGVGPEGVPAFVVESQLGAILAPGDVVPLAYVDGGTNVLVEGECDDDWHLHAAGPEGITILGFGPFPDAVGCGYGKVLNLEQEGPVGGRSIIVTGLPGG